MILLTIMLALQLVFLVLLCYIVIGWHHQFLTIKQLLKSNNQSNNHLATPTTEKRQFNSTSSFGLLRLATLLCSFNLLHSDKFVYPTSNNILDLVLSKIKTAKNDDLILLLDIIQKYANNQINRVDLYVSNIQFSKDCDCFNYFVQQMLNHHFKPYVINKVFQAIRDELNKRSGSCEASGTKLGEADSSVAND